MTAPSTTGTTPPATETDAGATPDESQLGDPGKAALAAERKRANDAEKAHRALAAELQAIKDKDADATDVATRKAGEAEGRATAAELKLARIEAGIAADLPREWWPRITGTTAEEMAADAKDLVKLLPAAGEKTPKPPAGKPREAMQPKPTGGGQPAGDELALNGDPIVAALEAKLGRR